MKELPVSGQSEGVVRQHDDVPSHLRNPLETGGASRPYDPAPDLSTEAGRLEKAIIKALRGVKDPEIPVNLYDMGLIYRLTLDSAKNVQVEMTLTAPNCPVAQTLPVDVKNAVESVDGVGQVDVDVVWEPSWHLGMMSEAARLELNL